MNRINPAAASSTEETPLAVGEERKARWTKHATKASEVNHPMGSRSKTAEKCGRGLLAATLNLEAHSKDLRLNRSKDSGVTFFVTKTLQPKKPMLNPDLRHKIVSSLAHGVRNKRIHLASFVVMPDHWHALLLLREPWTLPKFMHALMTFVGRETNRELQKSATTWQDGYHDTRIRTAKQFACVMNYIEQNPVKKGLAANPSGWEDSSAAQTDLLTDPWPHFYD